MSLNLLSPKHILSAYKHLLKNILENLLKSDNVEEFYDQIDLVNKKKFFKLAKYELLCLSMPLSNNLIVRIFSQTRVINTKLRNHINVDNLKIFIRVRAFRGINCFKNVDFKLLHTYFKTLMYK